MRNETEPSAKNPETDNMPNQVIRYVDTMLEDYGIRDITEDTENIENISLPVVPENPRVNNPEQFIAEHIKLLNELGIEPSSEVNSQKHTIKFTENGKQEELVLFTYQSTGKEDPTKPIVLFSHGGGIGGSSNEKSAYLRVLSAAGLNKSFLVAPDHRGSTSHLEKTKYSINERKLDLLIALRYFLEKNQDNWDGRLFLFGDSMGGHVSSVVAEILNGSSIPKEDLSLILTEPAMYTKEADSALWTNFVKGKNNLHKLLNTEGVNELGDIQLGQTLVYTRKNSDPLYIKLFREDDDGGEIFKLSYIQSALEDGASFSEKIRIKKPKKVSDSYALEALQKIERVLLVQMLQDEVVPSDIKKLLDDLIVQKDKSKIVNVPIGHQGTHFEEVRAIVDFVNTKDTN